MSWKRMFSLGLQKKFVWCFEIQNTNTNNNSREWPGQFFSYCILKRSLLKPWRTLCHATKKKWKEIKPYDNIWMNYNPQIMAILSATVWSYIGTEQRDLWPGSKVTATAAPQSHDQNLGIWSWPELTTEEVLQCLSPVYLLPL